MFPSEFCGGVCMILTLTIFDYGCGMDPVHYFWIVTADIQSCSAWSIVDRVHVSIIG